MLKRFVTIGHGLMSEDAVWCSACREWLRRVPCFDTESLEPGQDPRPNTEAPIIGQRQR